MLLVYSLFVSAVLFGAIFLCQLFVVERSTFFWPSIFYPVVILITYFEMFGDDGAFLTVAVFIIFPALSLWGLQCALNEFRRKTATKSLRFLALTFFIAVLIFWLGITSGAVNLCRALFVPVGGRKGNDTGRTSYRRVYLDRIHVGCPLAVRCLCFVAALLLGVGCASYTPFIRNSVSPSEKIIVWPTVSTLTIVHSFRAPPVLVKDLATIADITLNVFARDATDALQMKVTPIDSKDIAFAENCGWNHDEIGKRTGSSVVLVVDVCISGGSFDTTLKLKGSMRRVQDKKVLWRKTVGETLYYTTVEGGVTAATVTSWIYQEIPLLSRKLANDLRWSD